MNIGHAVALVRAELERAEQKFKPFNSHHEGYAVIKEELDELWDDVKANRKGSALKEAMQVAAMGLRYMVNLTPKCDGVYAACECGLPGRHCVCGLTPEEHEAEVARP